MSEPRALRWAPIVVAVALLAGLIFMRVQLAHSINVHWDEFYFLSKIHSYARGDLTGKLLTFHVHFLGWVRETSPNEVLQVLRIRQVMLAFGALAAVSTFFIGRRLIGSVGACFAIVAGQSFSLVLNHGASARYDPIVVALFLLAGALLVNGRGSRAGLAGVVTALCLLVSIKSALYLPTLGGLLLCRFVWTDDRRAVLRDAGLFAVAALLTFVPLLAWHAASLADPSTVVRLTGAPLAGAAGPSGLTAITAILSKVFVLELGVPNAKALVDSLRWNWAFWMLLLVGLVLSLVQLRDRDQRLRAAQVLCFALPLMTLLFYRNSFHYFYVSIVPAAALLVGLVFAAVHRRLAARPLVAAAAVGALAAPIARAAVLWFAYNSADQLEVQKEIVAGVHETFPTPVPYVDRCAMIGSFPKVGPFMSTWTLGEYRKQGTPVMRELLRAARPQLLVQNISSLELHRGFKGGRVFHRLLREDFNALKASFIPHWGPLWVAGKVVTLAPSLDVAAIDVVIAGPYVIEADHAVSIDGRAYEAGAVVDLGEGAHAIARVAPSEVESKVTLRTASAGPPPKRPPPRARVFEGFGYRTSPLPVANDADDPAAP